jgi:hypothetical protein
MAFETASLVATVIWQRVPCVEARPPRGCGRGSESARRIAAVFLKQPGVWVDGDGLSLGTSTKRAGPASSDACSDMAKQASPRYRSALSEVVRGRRPPVSRIRFRYRGRCGRLVAEPAADTNRTGFLQTPTKPGQQGTRLKSWCPRFDSGPRHPLPGLGLRARVDRLVPPPAPRTGFGFAGRSAGGERPADRDDDE